MNRENCRNDLVFSFINLENAVDVTTAESSLAESLEPAPTDNYVHNYEVDRSTNKLFESVASKNQIKEHALNGLVDRCLWPVHAVHVLAKFFGSAGLCNDLELNYECLKFSMWCANINKVKS